MHASDGAAADFEVGVADQTGGVVVQVAFVGAFVVVLGGGPEEGAFAEIAVSIVVEAASWEDREARGVVFFRMIAGCAALHATLPSGCGSQCLGVVLRIVVANVLRLAAHKVGQLGPFRIRRKVPAFGTNYLGGLPVVKVSVGFHVARAAVRTVAIRCAVAFLFRQQDFLAATIVCGAHIFRHPALRADTDGLVGVPIGICCSRTICLSKTCYRADYQSK